MLPHGPLKCSYVHEVLFPVSEECRLDISYLTVSFLFHMQFVAFVVFCIVELVDTLQAELVKNRNPVICAAVLLPLDVVSEGLSGSVGLV